MKSLLSPLIAFLSSISYKAKFMLIGLIAVTFTTFLVYKNYSALHEDVLFSQKEVEGVKLLTPVKNLILSTQKLRGTTASYLSGNASLKEKVNALAAETQAKLKVVNESFANTSLEGLDTLANEIDKDLTTLMAQASSMDSKAAFTKYTQIIQKELDLIVFTGDNSNLILDPEIDSFYLMDAVVNKLPIILENTGKMRGLGSVVLNEKMITTEETAKLMTFKSMSSGYLNGLKNGFQSAYGKNSSLKDKIDETKETLLEKFKNFRKASEMHVVQGQDMDSNLYFNMGTEILTVADKLYENCEVELTKLLEIRVAKLESKVTTLFIETVSFMVLLSLIFQAFYHSVSGTVNSVVRQLKEIEESKDLTRDLHVESKDELQDIATAYNSFRAAIQSTMQDALHAVDSSNNDALHMQNESKEIDINSQDMSKVISQMAQKGEEVKDELEISKELAQNSKEQIEIAYETLQKATESIQRLDSQVEESSHKEMEMADKINQLSQDASDVKSVLTVINDIAEQTNLLALNAAIEAARAGEHGRGFAVVADEVRQLAEKTQKSLSEINATINVIMQNITEASSEMNQNAQDISSMTETSREVLKEVEWVNTIMDEATKQIENSTLSIEKNAKGVEIMVDDLQSTDKLSEESSSKIASISNSSSALAGKVNEIKEKVNVFMV